jgi:hypothetical protein
MPQQKSLFESDEDIAPSQSTELAITAQKLGPEQRLFNQLLDKIEQQNKALQSLNTLAETHDKERQAKLAPLRTQVVALQEKLVLFLDQRLQTPKGLSLRACEDIEELIGLLLDDVLTHGEPSAQMQALADRYFGAEDDTLEDGLEDGLDLESSSELNKAMAQAMGVEVDAEGLLSTDDMIEALMRKMQADEDAALHAHEARQAKRKKSPKQKLAEQEQLDAHSALRSIYRKLVSALHPDRESDPAERTRKTALMVRVNAANDSKDLLALLRLQLEIAQIDPSSVAGMADDKLRGFNRMLKEQLKNLQAEYQDIMGRMRMVFDLGYDNVTPKAMVNALRSQTQHLQSMLEGLKHDLALIQDDKALKKWVKVQISLVDSPDYF